MGLKDASTHPGTVSVVTLLQVVIVPLVSWLLITTSNQGNDIAALKAENAALKNQNTQMLEEIRYVRRGVDELKTIIMNQP